MRTAIASIAALVATASLGLAGCDVKKTEDGNVTLPKYEVKKEKEGDVTLPKYDVTTPDVKVTSKQTEVTVPKVVTEKETVKVPQVEIKTGQEKAAEKEQAKK
jgi:hypothetical protein